MSSNTKQTSPKVASLAGKTLQSGSASAVQRSLAASALRQAGTPAQTGAKMEAKASGALDNARSSATTKTLAGSVVSQSNRKR
ncbi:hypothetical protein F3J24_04215 [Comamonas sp. Tr-654]|uniref:hypothetical protein n=1 Tax=Comamonas sp. Tr-654 TaxID=2608341 RepID=UPI0014202511|nr:hypothetical protein [Comamonas sp. Tr-654]NIF82715.1 hypothetical protein [Comamonas sp. Tr-654]